MQAKTLSMTQSVYAQKEGERLPQLIRQITHMITKQDREREENIRNKQNPRSFSSPSF